MTFGPPIVALAAALVILVLTGCSNQHAEPGARRETYEIAFRDCTDCPEMVIAPRGDFAMGSPPVEAGRDARSEGTQRTVRIGKPFAVGRYEVTVDEFRRFVRATSYDARATCWGKKTIADRYEQLFDDWRWDSPDVAPSGSAPVACVSWEDAKAYTDWLSHVTNQRYRLLTEAEWEYTARAGTTGMSRAVLKFALQALLVDEAMRQRPAVQGRG